MASSACSQNACNALAEKVAKGIVQALQPKNPWRYPRQSIEKEKISHAIGGHNQGIQEASVSAQPSGIHPCRLRGGQKGSRTDIDSFRNNGHAAGVGHVLSERLPSPCFKKPCAIGVDRCYRDRTANVGCTTRGCLKDGRQRWRSAMEPGNIWMVQRFSRRLSARSWFT